MTALFWKKASHFLGFLAVGVLFALTVFAANVEIKDLDLWLHIKMGEFILAHGYIPQTDVLSCTIIGRPWINHEWLFQVIAYLIYHHGGPDGLISMQVFVVVLTFLILLLLGYSRERQWAVVFLLLLVMLVYRLRFTIRPDIFSLLFFASYIYILALHTDKRWTVYALVFIQILWANFHGFFFFGPCIVLVGICAEYLKRKGRLPGQWRESGRLTDSEFSRLKRILFCVILASLVNPETFKGAWYPIDVLMNLAGKHRIFFGYIQELRRPFSLETFFSSEVLPHYKLLIILSAFSFILNRKKIDIGDLFVWFVFLLVSLVAIRNLVFFSFVAYLVCLTNLSSISMDKVLPFRFTSQKFQYMTACLFKVFLILWMLNFGSLLAQQRYFDFDKFELKSEFGGVALRNYPDKAADFLVANGIKGNFFNDFNSGAYLIGRAFPSVKVFIDGRTEVYGPDFFNFYQKIWDDADAQAFEKAVGQYHLTGAFLNSVHRAIPRDILQLLYNDKNWVMVYFDYDAVIFLKDIAQNRDWINRLRIDLSSRKVPAMDLLRLGSRAVGPYRYINRAYSLETLNFNQAALAEAQEALAVAPNYAEAYKIMGKIYGKEENYAKAFESFRIAATFLPGDSETRLNLALAYEKLGHLPDAIKQYRTLINHKPKDPRGHFMLTRAYAQEGQYDNALAAAKKAHQLAPGHAAEFIEIGDIVYKKDAYDAAQKIFTMALEAKKDLASVHNKIGLCYQGLGLKAQAIEEFKKGLAIDANHEELKKNLQTLSEPGATNP